MFESGIAFIVNCETFASNDYICHSNRFVVMIFECQGYFTFVRSICQQVSGVGWWFSGWVWHCPDDSQWQANERQNDSKVPSRFHHWGIRLLGLALAFQMLNTEVPQNSMNLHGDCLHAGSVSEYTEQEVFRQTLQLPTPAKQAVEDYGCLSLVSYHVLMGWYKTAYCEADVQRYYAGLQASKSWV